MLSKIDVKFLLSAFFYCMYIPIMITYDSLYRKTLTDIYLPLSLTDSLCAYYCFCGGINIFVVRYHNLVSKAGFFQPCGSSTTDR